MNRCDSNNIIYNFNLAKPSTENDMNAGHTADTNDDDSLSINEMAAVEDDNVDTTADDTKDMIEDENDANEDEVEMANGAIIDNNEENEDGDDGDDDDASNVSEKEEGNKDEEDISADNDGTSSKKRPSADEAASDAPSAANDDDKSPLPSLPLKKARTAYFIFAQDKREELKQKYQGEGVAAISKATGELWKSLQQAEKEVYEGQAAQEREKYMKDKQRLIDAGVWPESNSVGGGGGADGGEYDEEAIIFPIGRIRKICKLDGDVKGMSKEATLLVAKATELFASKLGSEVVTMAQMSNRRKLLPDDVVEVCSVKERFMFLKDDLQDLVSEQKEILKEKENEKASSGKSDKSGGGGKATSSLFSYFGKVHND
jgi:DNA-directed RNA polymerase I subunit RPA43